MTDDPTARSMEALHQAMIEMHSLEVQVREVASRINDLQCERANLLVALNKAQTIADESFARLKDRAALGSDWQRRAEVETPG